MADNIYDNQPCYWSTVSAVAAARYPSDTIGGVTATLGSSYFATSNRNARIQSIMINATPAGAGTITLTPLIGGGSIIINHTGARTEPHDLSFGGDVGTFMRGGFSITPNSADWNVVVFWRPE